MDSFATYKHERIFRTVRKNESWVVMNLLWCWHGCSCCWRDGVATLRTTCASYLYIQKIAGTMDPLSKHYMSSNMLFCFITTQETISACSWTSYITTEGGRQWFQVLRQSRGFSIAAVTWVNWVILVVQSKSNVDCRVEATTAAFIIDDHRLSSKGVRCDAIDIMYALGVIKVVLKRLPYHTSPNFNHRARSTS